MNAQRAKKKDSITMASEIVLRKPAELLAYPTNSRTHSPEQIEQIIASIKQFGFTNPILIKENTIGAGHGRLLASVKLEMPLVPTVDLSHLSDQEFKAYVIADNQLAMNAGWDFEILKTELASLEHENFDISVIGFDEFALNSIFNEINFGDSNTELNMLDMSDDMELKFRFSSINYQAVREKLLEHDETLETSLLKALDIPGE